MKRTLIAVALVFLAIASCTRDEFYIEEYSAVPEQLKMIEASGIRLENYIVEEEVSINVKLPEAGTYRIKLKDIEGTTVSQERITAEAGDNILKIYVNTLAKSSYTIQVESETGAVIGRDLFSKI